MSRDNRNNESEIIFAFAAVIMIMGGCTAIFSSRFDREAQAYAVAAVIVAILVFFWGLFLWRD